MYARSNCLNKIPHNGLQWIVPVATATNNLTNRLTYCQTDESLGNRLLDPCQQESIWSGNFGKLFYRAKWQTVS